MNADLFLLFVVIVAWLAVGLLLGGEQLRALQRQAEWDAYCADATDLTDVCMVEDCNVCGGAR